MIEEPMQPDCGHCYSFGHLSDDCPDKDVEQSFFGEEEGKAMGWCGRAGQNFHNSRYPFDCFSPCGRHLCTEEPGCQDCQNALDDLDVARCEAQSEHEAEWGW